MISNDIYVINPLEFEVGMNIFCAQIDIRMEMRYSNYGFITTKISKKCIFSFFMNAHFLTNHNTHESKNER